MSNRLMRYHVPRPVCQRLLAVLVAIYLAVLGAATLNAQTATDVSWQSHAEARLQAIYNRGEFSAKRVQPKWLSDSSGFLLDEVDPITKEVATWFYDAQTCERRSATDNQKNENSNCRRQRSKSNNEFELKTRGGNLFAVHRENQSETSLVTSPGNREIAIRNPVWSPDGSKVLFIQTDFSDVRKRSVLVPSDPSYPEVQQHRFARVGEKLERQRIGVVNHDGKELTWLPIECPEEGMYLGQIEWAGNSDEVLVERFSRFRDQRDFLLVNVGGEAKTIFSESDEAWVEASQGWNSGLVWIRDGQEFVVVSEKDGWRHAYRYSRDGQELGLLTPGEYDIIERAVIDEDRGWYYFYASPQDGTQRYLYRVPLDGSGKAERISPESQIGTHRYLFSPDAKWAIHTFSTLNTPPVHELIEVETHRVVKVLEDNSEIRDRMAAFACSPAEFLKLDIGDGIEFDAWMLKPKDFDPTKKYPLFIYVYGEPHAQTVLNEWGAAQIDFHRVVAELGYVVVSIDNRGTPCPKGAAWRRAIFGSLGPLSTEEQAAGLKALAKQCDFIDTDRVGIWGWSGGGSNTLNALFRKPDSYHVGIAVVPKPQPHLYNAWFQEIYMRTREVNPEGYEKSAPINFAEGLQGKLLIMTGSGETNTHIQIIEGLVDRLIALSKPFDYMVYPNRDHGLREGDGTVVHVRMHILRYLINNLPSGPRSGNPE
ncbi:MAG: DPP IV N-terminal domain-containing protein [Pirellulaceae bacterium]|nr:DPP IV N-terminal domain-containing protein [Pirellulaceae bacterium]